MAHQVFISYARKTSSDYAKSLHKELGGEKGLAFLDTTDIDTGDRFPKEIIDAIFAAKVVVVFADKAYFQRPYCQCELETALAPFVALLSRPSTLDEEKTAALRHIVVALPTGNRQSEMDFFPPSLKVTSWPEANNIKDLATLVLDRVKENRETLGAQLKALNADESFRQIFIEETLLPQPANLAGTRVVPLNAPQTIRNKFVGRADDLWRIHFTLSPMRGAPVKTAARTVALGGGSGFGKTRLAIEYLHRFGPRYYPGGIFWVDADADEGKLEERFYDILKSLKPNTPEIAACRNKGMKIKESLEHALHDHSAEKPILFIVDNIPVPFPGSPPKHLETWCPAVGKVSLLVTSQLKIDNVEALPLNPLSTDAGVALLTSGVDARAIDKADWEAIAEKWVGNLPLVLEVLNRCMLKGAVSAKELLKKAKTIGPAKEIDRQMEAIRCHIPEGHLRGVTEAFMFSYNRLDNEEQRTARLLAQLAPDPIPKAIVDALIPNRILERVRSTLITRSIVIPWEDSRILYGSIHRVMADFLRSNSDDQSDELLAICVAVSQKMTRNACRNPKHRELMSYYLPHADQLVTRKNEGAGQSKCLVKLRICVGFLLSERRLLKKAKKIQMATISQAIEEFGGSKPETLTAMNDLAETMRMQGHYEEARKMHEQVLEARQRTLGKEDPDTLASGNNLSLTLWNQGLLPEALKLQKRVLRGRRRNLREDDPDMLRSVNILALMMIQQSEKQRDVARARRILAKTRRIQEQVLKLYRGKKNDNNYLTLMTTLAVTMHMQGKRHWEKARELHKQVLAVRKKKLDEEDTDRLTSMSKLALVMRDQKDFDGALELQWSVLEVCARVFGKRSSDSSVSAWDYFMTLVAANKMPEAQAVHKQYLQWLIDDKTTNLPQKQDDIRKHLAHWAKRTHNETGKT